MVDSGSFSDKLHIQTTKAQQLNAEQIGIVQDGQAEDFKETIEIAFNPIAMRNRFERLETRIKKSNKEEETGKAEKTDEIDFAIEGVQETAEQFEQKNPELAAISLIALRSRLSKNASLNDLLTEITQTYPDFSLADEALDFLISTSDPDFAEKLIQVKNQLNETYGREIRAGKNIMANSQDFAKQNLGSPSSLRELYRDITGNPRDPSTLFAELANQYTFDKMKTVVAFILHSLGQDLKSKGPSIDKGELHRLLTEARSMQAILGVYRFFQSRMSVILKSFLQHEMIPSSRINFENLARGFMKLLLERYPSCEKIMQLGAQMGLQDELLAEIIIFTQMKDAVRQTSPRLYRSEQHKQDVLGTFLETLEDLEDQLEEEEEEKEEEKEEENKK